MGFTAAWHDFFDKPLPNFLLRTVIMLIGAAMVAFSVALSRDTGLGTSPISCVPATLSFLTPLTVGTWTFIINLVFIALQIILLRRDYNPFQLFQLPFLFIFSMMIDLFVPVAELIPLNSYPLQLLAIVCCCFITACGVVLQVKSSLIMLSADALVVTISRVFHFDFAKTKIGFDCTMALTSVVISLIWAGYLLGVREGTVIFALCTGLCTKVFYWLFRNFELVVPIQGHITLLPKENTEANEDGQSAPGDPLVITIAREYGSGGREIGHAIANELGVKCYDSSLISMVSKESGLTLDYVKSHEEEVRRGILYSLVAQNYEYVGAKPADTDALFLAQARTITKLAERESCVIVGRNANYILASRPNCFNIFVHAPLEARIERVMRRDNVSREQAEKDIERIDRERAEHAFKFTGRARGLASDYQLTIDSSLTDSATIAKSVVALATK